MGQWKEERIGHKKDGAMEGGKDGQKGMEGEEQETEQVRRMDGKKERKKERILIDILQLSSKTKAPSSSDIKAAPHAKPNCMCRV